MKEISHNQLKDHIDVNYKVKQPLMIHGSIGIGKSQMVEEQAENLCPDDREFIRWNKISNDKKEEVKNNASDYFVFLDIRLSQYDPTDIKGLPDLDGDEVIWKLMSWAKYATDKDASGVVFFDEINLAPNSVQAAFYQLILKGEISEYALSDDVYVLAAGNRAGKDRANVYEMAGPLRDRFNHVELLPPNGGNSGNWVEYAIENGLNEKVVAFISSPMGEDKLNTFPDNRDAKVFSTPRSWEKVSDMLDKAEDELSLTQMEDVVSSVVGEGVASEFRAFIELRQSVDVDALLDDPERVKKFCTNENTSLDKKYSVISALAKRYGNNKDVLDDLVEIAMYLYQNEDAEFAIMLLRLAAHKNKQYFKKNVVKSDHWNAISEGFSDYIDLSRGGL